MTQQLPPPRNSTIAAHFYTSKLVIPFRVLLALMSVAGLFYWLYITLFLVGWAGRYILFYPPTTIILLFGYTYLLLSVYACVKNLSIKALSILGIVLNLPLAGFVVYSLSHIEDKIAPPIIVYLAFVLAWFFYWVTGWFVSRNTSLWKQIVVLVVIVAGIGLIAARIWPLTTDPEAEAERLSVAALHATNPDDRKRLFDQAIEQAHRIKNPYARDQPLVLIASYQAKANRVEDAEVTASMCASESCLQMAYNEIVRAQVGTDHLAGAVSSARAHNSGEVLFMALRDTSVTKAKAGESAKARELVQFAEKLAVDPSFRSNREGTFGSIAVAQAQLGMHEEALSSARKASDSYASTHLIMVAMTEKEAGYIDQSRASIQEAIRDVIASRKTDGDRDHTLYELSQKLATAGFSEEAKVVANTIRFFSTRQLALKNILDDEARRAQTSPDE